jgi:DNA polymerase-3 subunit epsilon
VKPDQLDQQIWDSLPNQPGVYRFWGPDGELLYVGKSTQIRNRVRSHFNPSNKTYKHDRLYGETHDITTKLTAGDLSASLLELHEIKERQPLLNKRSRKKKQLVVAVQDADDSGFLFPKLQLVTSVSNSEDRKILGVFRSKKQATEIIETLARKYELCRRKLQISTAGNQNRSCFYYQLGQCRGACIGREKKREYNKRFRQALADYAVRSWPFAGSVVVADTTDTRRDIFVVNKWCLQEAKTVRDDTEKPFFASTVLLDRFYYDVYKTLSTALLNPDETDVKIETNIK